MAKYEIFSADSHVSEPGDLWMERIDKELQFRAPRIEQRERNGRLQDFFIYEGFPPHPAAIGLGAASRTGTDGTPEAFRNAGRGYADARPGGWDPAQRLQDQDVDGVVGEVLITTLCFRLFWMSDAKLQRACFRVYNDWLSEFCSYAPERLVGVPLISLTDIPLAIEELERTAKRGMKGAMIWLSPPEPYPAYSSFAYDPFWAAAQEMEMPIVLHENTGGAETRLSPSSYWDEAMSLGAIVRPHEVQRTLGQIILSGVLERFPRLKVVSMENHTDWLPWYVKRVARVRSASYPTPLSLKPVEYLQRQVSFTYIDEPEAMESLELVGVENMMFSTDYPHSAATWPHSQEIVERDLGAMAPEVRQQIIHDNVLRVFGIKAPVLV
jgi:predicted TIM-barrel fold metal-dependent hydrolase